MNFSISLLPEFFASPRNEDALRQAVRTVLPLLGCENGSRNWFIAIDETYYTPSWQLISGLQGDGRLIVGGHWGENEESDFSTVPADEDTPDDSRLSRMTLDFLACSTVDTSKAWHIAMLPMSMGANNGKAVLQLRVLDAIMHAAALENGCPPLGISTDAGSINTLTQDLFVGFTDCLQHVGECKFFNKCTPVSLQYLPYCIWRHLKFQHGTSSHNLLGVLDALHSLKRYTYHHFTSTRCVLWGTWFSGCWPTLHAGGGISRKAFTLQDTMSDEQPLCRQRLSLLELFWLVLCRVLSRLFWFSGCINVSILGGWMTAGPRAGSTCTCCCRHCCPAARKERTSWTQRPGSPTQRVPMRSCSSACSMLASGLVQAGHPGTSR